MKRIFIPYIFCLLTSIVYGQDPAYPAPTNPAIAGNIIKAEFFVDADPGFGNGTDIPITAATDLNNISFNVPTNALTAAMHRLHVRTLNAEGKWSLNIVRDFLVDANPVYPSPTNPATAGNIVKAEFFVDTDPGFGNGTDIPITAATDLNNISINVPTNSLTAAMHRLHVRTLNVEGKWSLNIVRDFLVDANPAYPAALAIAGNIVKAEFFIDTDPGFGNGTSIAITASTDLNNISFSVPSNALTAGTHRLHFRTLNIEGKWSLSTIQSFTVLQTNITWSGSTSTNWNLASNWVQATIPTSSDTAIIPSTTVTNQPALGNNTTIAKLSVGTGKTLTIASGFTLNNTGDLIINGTITGNGKVELNGVSSQTISGNGSIANLTINNAAGAAVGITTSDTLKVTGVLTPTTGTLTTNNKLVLKSSSVANTAQIGKVGATASINGNAQVERFVPIGRRAYRMLAPGVTTATSIKDNWQEGVNNPNTSTNNNPNPGFGTHITGANSALGFDVTQSGNPSMQLYNPATQTFSFINNSNVLTLNAKSGYPIFIRGNRGIDLNSNSSNSVTTLRATGSLQTGTIIYNNASTPALNTTSEGYSLIGNPYWSLVDWEAVAKSEIASTYFIWDPNINTRGGYTSYTTGGATSGGGAISRYIQPGQAIFMQNTVGASNPVLTFNESNKDSSQVLTATFRTQRQAEIAGKFTVRLYTPALFIEGRVADAATIGFSKDYMAAYNANEDASKLTNPDENLSFKHNGRLYGYNGTSLPNKVDTAWLNITTQRINKYILEVEGKEFIGDGNLIDAWLIDSYKNTSTKLDKAGKVSIDYSIDSSQVSKMANRFFIVFNNNKIQLPVSNGLELKLTPNPATDFVQVNFEAKQNDIATIRIININGQVMQSMNLGKQQTGQVKMPVRKLAAGIYTVELIVGEQKRTAKLIKE